MQQVRKGVALSSVYFTAKPGFTGHWLARAYYMYANAGHSPFVFFVLPLTCTKYS